jgi:hypothetical protein
MTPEQVRTLAHLKAEYDRMQSLHDRNRLKSTRDWHHYLAAKDAYYGYQRWLDTYVLNRAAA